MMDLESQERSTLAAFTIKPIDQNQTVKEDQHIEKNNSEGAEITEENEEKTGTREESSKHTHGGTRVNQELKQGIFKRIFSFIARSFRNVFSFISDVLGEFKTVSFWKEVLKDALKVGFESFIKGMGTSMFSRDGQYSGGANADKAFSNGDVHQRAGFTHHKGPVNRNPHRPNLNQKFGFPGIN